MEPGVPTTPSHRYDVLLIEDDEVDRIAVRRALDRGWRVSEVGSLAKARTAQEDAPTQCVLLDLNLPDCRGLQTVARAKEIFADVPVVVLTGLEDDELGAQAVQVGAQDYLPKSQISPTALRRAIRHAIERQSVLKALRDSSQQWRSIMQSVPDVVMTTDRHGRISYVSRPFLGRPPQEILGTLMPDLFPRLQAEQVTEAIDRVLRDGDQQILETTLRDEGGREAWLNVRVGTFVRESSVIGAVAVFRDTTETQRLKAQVQHAQRMEALGRLAGGVAHDLNNLLTVIVGAAELLGDSLDDDDVGRNDVADILDASERIVGLTDQLLSFSRRRTIAPERVDVRQSLQELDAILRRSIGPRVELSITAPPEAWPVLMDRVQFDQLLLNLAVNGRDAMPDGGALTIEARNAEDLGPGGGLPRGDYLVLEVADQGVGLAPEIQEHIFEPFFTTKGEEGTGLGLATCFGIVDQAGGRIEVDSTPGEGTRFRVLLPRAASDATTVPSASVAGPEGTEATVLVVADDAHVDWTASVLRAGGFDVETLSSAEDAIGRFERLPVPDIVVSEAGIGGSSGIELGRTLRERRPGLPFLLLETSRPGEPGAWPRTGTALPFLRRPFGSDTLVRRVQELLGRVPRREEDEEEEESEPL